MIFAVSVVIIGDHVDSAENPWNSSFFQIGFSASRTRSHCPGKVGVLFICVCYWMPGARYARPGIRGSAPDYQNFHRTRRRGAPAQTFTELANTAA